MISIPFLLWVVIACLVYHQLRIRRFTEAVSAILAFFTLFGVIEILLTPAPPSTPPAP